MPDTPGFREFTDLDATRDNIYSGVKDAVSKRFPMSNQSYALELADVDYDKPKKYSLKEQKQAILDQRSLDNPLYGTWRLRDLATNQVASESRKIVARVPHLTERGTFIFRGNEYTLSNQARLRPGIYARKKENGELESHANLLPGTGRSFRIFMEPSTGVFKFQLGQGFLPAFPVLKALGATDDSIKASWGDKLFAVNASKGRDFDLAKVYEKFADSSIRKAHTDPQAGIRALFAKMGIDPDVSLRNLGKPYGKIDSEVLLRASQKLLHISQGKEEEDDRDSQANQILMSPEDIFPERIAKDAGNMIRTLLWKVSNKKDVSKIPSSYLSKQIYGALLTSGLGAPGAEVNPLETWDQVTRVSRMGVGGISNLDAIPDEARNVHPSQLGLIDIIRAPESLKIGVDQRLAHGTLRGPNNMLYRRVTNAQGKEEIVNARQMVHSIVGFPGEMHKDGKVRALVNGKISYVDKDTVNYWIPSGNDMFHMLSNLVPGFSSVKAGRLLMGSKYFTQALPLHEPEAPLVRSMFPGNKDHSFEEEYGKLAHARFAPEGGTVTKVTPDSIEYVDKTGKKQQMELYNNFPLNQKTQLNSTALVKPGDKFNKGQVLAKSNFTDKHGTLAVGTNLRVAYIPYKGNYEDGIVISASAAKKLTSEHMYNVKVDHDPDVTISRKSYISIYPTKFNKQQLEGIDDNGIVKPGTILHEGDPMVLAVGNREPTKGLSILKQKRSWNTNEVQLWDHIHPGIVTDVSHGHDGVKVTVKAYAPMRVGDKASSRYASKGVISEIVPDDQMPHDGNGKPFEVIMNPMGIISRVNPALLSETLLGKLARKHGKPYNLPAFRDNDSLLDYTMDELKKHGVPETEDIVDPATNRTLKNVFTGEQFVMKLHHTAESKASSRDTGLYSLDNTPATGSEGQAKRVGVLETNALISHGATNVIKDFKLIRGQRNDDYWRRFRMGMPAPMPEKSFMYEKFLNMLQAAGVNVQRQKDITHFMTMTDKDIHKLSNGRELTSGDALDLKTQSPIEGGLFDVGLTGGRDGNRWSHISLHEKIPNPIMEDPIIRLLGLTGPKFDALIKTKDGSKTLENKLKAINVDDEIERAKNEIRSDKSSKRDLAVKRLRVLTMCKENDIHPRDFMISKVPVLPPLFRPVAMMKGMELTSDSNLLYKDLFEANKALQELGPELDDTGEERANVYHAVKAVTGLGDPINVKNKEKNVAGMLAHIFGKGSPKYGLFQRKLLSTTVDAVGRSVITPDSALDMDHVGMPEDLAWNLYRPHIMRKLAQKYNAGPHKVDLTELAKWVANKDPRAKQALLDELKERPVMVSRAPVLHKYGIMGAWPILTKGDTLRMSPITSPGFNFDFDGDTMNFHVPSSQEAVKEVIEKMLPSKNLISTGDFKPNWMPRQEYLHGLWAATRAAETKEPQVFKNKKEVITALLAGKLNITDPVKIIGE